MAISIGVRWRVIIAALVLLVCSLESGWTQVPWAASVKIDTVFAAPGNRVGVPVRLINNPLEFCGLHIPLQVKSPYITVDSVSRIGNFLTADFDLMIRLIPDSDTLELAVFQKDFTQVPVPYMPATDGLIGTIWVTVAPDAPLGVALIDSLCIYTLLGEPGNQFPYWKKVNGADRNSTTIMPGFIRGGVRVEQFTDVADVDGLLPQVYGLRQNHPNPFNPSTAIGFALPRASEIRLRVFNLLGREVAVAAEGRFPAGDHEVTFDASACPSGVYLYRLEYAGGSLTRKMLLVK